MQNVFIEFMPPWVETGLQPAFYDKESGTVLQQVARMYAKVNELVKAFDDFSEDVTTTVNHYIEEFTTLYNYVHDYFDNLDVQEEINHKLDEMADDGTLQNIIYDYLNAKAIFAFDNVEDMLASENLVDGSYAQTLGFYSKNDGGKALYLIRALTNDDTIDNVSLFEMTNDDTLVAELVIDDSMNVKQFGIKADGTTDMYTKLTSVLALGVTKLYFPSGSYYLSEVVNVPNTCKTIIGDNVSGTTILCEQSGFVIQNVFYTVIKNITIKNKDENQTYNGITGQLKSVLFENVRIQYFDRGLNISGGSWVNTFNKCIFEHCNYGVYKDNDGDFNDNEFFRCNISANSYGAYIVSSNQNITFHGCDMEDNDKIIMSGGYTNNMIIDSCYCEGNNNIYSIISGFNDQSKVTIKNCRIYQPNNTSVGWIAIGRTMASNVSGKASPIIVSNNMIFYRNISYKPLCFDTTVALADTPNSLIVFNVYQNSFLGTASNNFPAEYFDLIDTTNFPNYCRTSQRRTVDTDLIYKVIDTHLFCELKNRGYINGVGRAGNKFHFFGYSEFTSTGTAVKVITIPNECGVYPAIDKKLYGMIYYTDNSVAIVPIGIDANSITVSNLDTSKTTAYVSIDFTCFGG